MIIKSFEIRKINQNKSNIILIYGENEGLKNNILDNLIKDKNNIFKYEEKDILDNNNEASTNKIKININTEYKKTINSKNATGAAASYELVSKTLIDITKNNKTDKLMVVKRFIIDKNDNSVDQNNYERTIKETFASSIVEQLRFKINSLEWLLNPSRLEK